MSWKRSQWYTSNFVQMLHVKWPATLKPLTSEVSNDDHPVTVRCAGKLWVLGLTWIILQTKCSPPFNVAAPFWKAGRLPSLLRLFKNGSRNTSKSAVLWPGYQTPQSPSHLSIHGMCLIPPTPQNLKDPLSATHGQVPRTLSEDLCPSPGRSGMFWLIGKDQYTFGQVVLMLWLMGVIF